MANNSYDEYIRQLNKYKASEKNDINNANLKAKTYLENYKKALGLSGSGTGMSADIQLAQNTNEQLANVNKTYDQALMNYQQQYNANKQSQAKELLGSMNETDRNTYLDNLSKDNGITGETYDYISAYKNALVNQELQNKNQNALNAFKNYVDVGTLTPKEIEERLNNYSQQGINEDILNQMRDYADASGLTWKNEANKYIDELKDLIASATNNNDTDTTNKLDEISKNIATAQQYGTKADYQKALDELMVFNKSEEQKDENKRIEEENRKKEWNNADTSLSQIKGWSKYKVVEEVESNSNTYKRIVNSNLLGKPHKVADGYIYSSGFKSYYLKDGKLYKIKRK